MGFSLQCVSVHCTVYMFNDYSTYWWINLLLASLHCKKWLSMKPPYFQSIIIMFSLPIPTRIYLLAIYIFLRTICLFFCRKYVDRSWEYINRSQTHECGNKGWGRAIPRKGIHNWNFHCSVYSRGLHFYTFFGISIGIKRRLIDNAKKITFLLFAKCLKMYSCFRICI